MKVKRTQVLERARDILNSGKWFGLCHCIDNALYEYTKVNITYTDLKCIFPLFTCKTAHENGFKPMRTLEGYSDCGFWWERDDPNRAAFLDWLIEQYKDDKTDVMKLRLVKDERQIQNELKTKQDYD